MQSQVQVIEAVDHCVSEGMNTQLTQIFTAEEVSIALKQMHLLKALGPDGLPVLFFQSYWHIVGSRITERVLNFFNNGCLNKKLNHTLIALIPKVKRPSSLSQFRPISLSNVVYKLASKVLANRLKVILDDIISSNQSAFIPGRLITENVLASFELNHFLKRRTGVPKGFLSQA